MTAGRTILVVAVADDDEVAATHFGAGVEPEGRSGSLHRVEEFAVILVLAVVEDLRRTRLATIWQYGPIAATMGQVAEQ